MNYIKKNLVFSVIMLVIGVALLITGLREEGKVLIQYSLALDVEQEQRA